MLVPARVPVPVLAHVVVLALVPAFALVPVLVRVLVPVLVLVLVLALTLNNFTREADAIEHRDHVRSLACQLKPNILAREGLNFSLRRDKSSLFFPERVCSRRHTIRQIVF